MYKSLLAGALALALVFAYTTNISANPENKFGDHNSAEAQSNATAIGTNGGGGEGAGVSLGLAAAFSESFNETIEVISVQTLEATVTGAHINIHGGDACSDGGEANAGDGIGTGGDDGDGFGIGASLAVGGGGGGGGDGSLNTGSITVAAGAGTFGGINIQNVSSGLYNATQGGVSVAAHAGLNIGN